MVWFAPPPEPGIQWVWAVKRQTTLGTITMIAAMKLTTKTLGRMGRKQCEILHNVACSFT